MKGRVFLLIVVLTAGILFFSCTKKKNDGEGNVYVFGVDSTWPPMEFIDTDTNQIVGFTIDLVNAIGKEEGFNAKFITTAWDGIFAGLSVGDYDAISSSVTITEERKKVVAFSDPYFDAGQLLAMRKDQSVGIKGLQDLAGKEIAAQIGTSGAELIRKYEDVVLKTYPDLGPAAEELANGTIFGIVADSPLIAQYLLKNEKYEGLFTVVGGPMTSEQYGFAFPLEKNELKDLMNAGLEKVKENGTFDKLVKEWIQ